VVSVLATGPKRRGFKPGRGHEFSSAIKVRSLGSSNKSTSQGRIIHFIREVPPDLLLDDSADRIARELWRTNQFPRRYNSTMVHHAHTSISSGG
jgi:hypothetical protein